MPAKIFEPLQNKIPCEGRGRHQPGWRGEISCTPQPRARVLAAFCPLLSLPSLGTGTGGAAGGTGSPFGAGRRDHLLLAVARGDVKTTFPSANADCRSRR